MELQQILLSTEMLSVHKNSRDETLRGLLTLQRAQELCYEVADAKDTVINNTLGLIKFDPRIPGAIPLFGTIAKVDGKLKFYSLTELGNSLSRKINQSAIDAAQAIYTYDEITKPQAAFTGDPMQLNAKSILGTEADSQCYQKYVATYLDGLSPEERQRLEIVPESPIQKPGLSEQQLSMFHLSLGLKFGIVKFKVEEGHSHMLKLKRVLSSQIMVAKALSASPEIQYALSQLEFSNTRKIESFLMAGDDFALTQTEQFLKYIF